MSCALTQSFTLDCGRDNVAGIKEIYIVEQSAIATNGVTTNASGTITAIAMNSSKLFFTYKLVAETGQFKETQDIDPKNGTMFWGQTVTLPLFKMETTKRNELKLVGQSPVAIIVRTSKDKYWLCGESFGLNLTKRDADTGKDLGDFAGYNLTFEGKETDAAKEVYSAIIAALLSPLP